MILFDTVQWFQNFILFFIHFPREYLHFWLNSSIFTMQPLYDRIFPHKTVISFTREFLVQLCAKISVIFSIRERMQYSDA